MSESFPPPTFGQQTFIDVSASGNFSGSDIPAMLDATQLYQDHDYQGQNSLPVRFPEHESYAQDDPFAYVSHSHTSPTLPSLQTMPPMATQLNQYDHEVSILDNMQNFSPVNSMYGTNTYQTPYPDSNATSTSSATSPERAMGAMAEVVVMEADDDKRKRNQAASARFRQKKKQREQSLMEASREMQEKTKKLESENDGLRKENLFLKKLLVEKVDHMSEEDRDLLLSAAGDALRKKK